MGKCDRISLNFVETEKKCNGIGRISAECRRELTDAAETICNAIAPSFGLVGFPLDFAGSMANVPEI